MVFRMFKVEGVSGLIGECEFRVAEGFRVVWEKVG